MWHYFPGNYMFSYQLIRILTQAQYGGGEFNECLEAADRIETGNRESFYDAWRWQGDRVFGEAEAAGGEGRGISASAAYLRASNYLRTAEFFLQPADERKLPTYLKAVESFRKGVALWEKPPRTVEIPYEDSFLPGYFFEVAGQDKGPLVIMFGGLDSCAEELWFGPACLMVARGVSVLVVDGPGQGGALRLNHIPTRYDYEVPATISLDWAIANLPIDPERVGILAVSMGGYMAARSAAFEHRFAACAIWGAVYDYYEVWAGRPDDHPLANIVQHIVGADNMTEARTRLKQFTMAGHLDKIKAPTFIVHGEDDRQNFVSHAYRVYEGLTCEKEMIIVPKESTGSSHCSVDNFTKVYPMLDWLAGKLGSTVKSSQPIY